MKTMAKLTRPLGMKFAIVAYDDNDPDNKEGPINPEYQGVMATMRASARSIFIFNCTTHSNAW